MLNHIIIQALKDSDNYNSDGTINWNFVESDLWNHSVSSLYSKEEKVNAIENFPKSLIPSVKRGK